jgi:hypothetical protein
MPPHSKTPLKVKLGVSSIREKLCRVLALFAARTVDSIIMYDFH